MASMIVPKKTACPVCGAENASAAAALRCWLRHNPDLSARNTLAVIGEHLGVTRERVRQVLKRGGEDRRAGPQYRPPEARPRRAPARPAERRMLPPRAAVRDQPAPWLRMPPTGDPGLERRRELDRAREMTDHRRDYKRRRHHERMASDPAYGEARREKARRKYARQRARQARDQSRRERSDE